MDIKNRINVLFVLCLLLFSISLVKQTNKVQGKQVKETILAVRRISLSDRYSNKYVNNIFKDNILLTLFYMRYKNISANKINWKRVKEPFRYALILKPNQTFAFHSNVLPKYIGKIDKTTNAHFNSKEGFKSDGYLTGDGVCHLASLMYWVSSSAHLKSYAPTRHSFAVIPDIPARFGVSIYDSGNNYGSELQNLYITNNLKNTVSFVFNYDGKNLKISAIEL